jgi:hypothetical protein
MEQPFEQVTVIDLVASVTVRDEPLLNVMLHWS